MYSQSSQFSEDILSLDKTTGSESDNMDLFQHAISSMSSNKIFETKEISLLFNQLIEEKNYETAVTLLKNNKIINSNAFENWIDKQFSERPMQLASLLRLALADPLTANKILNPLKNSVKELLKCCRMQELNAAFLEMLLSVCHDTQQEEFLKLYSRKKYITILTDALSKVAPPEKQDAITRKLIQLSIKQANAPLLRLLVDRDKMPEYKLTEKEQTLMMHLLSLDESAHKKIMELMNQFYGFGQNESLIQLSGGLLTCAEIHNRKKGRYDFSPTVLNRSELEEYLQTLKKARPPLRERFVLTGLHWITGDIQIEADGQINVLIIDSLGNKKICLETSWAMKMIAQCFPTVKLYWSIEQRQHDEVSCSVYALDDVRHLFTIEKYLDKKYATTGLFGYLKDPANRSDLNEEKGRTKIFTFEAIQSYLPLPFLRTMQTRKLFGFIGSRSPEEQKTPGEKSGKTVIEAAREDFVEKEEKNVNQRLSRKLDKMMHNNARFFIHVGDEKKIEKQMQQFTLMGLKKRCAEEPPQSGISI